MEWIYHFSLFQLPFVQWISTCRTPIADLYFSAWNYVDRIEFVLLLLPFAWIFCKKNQAHELFFMVSLSAMFNTILKILFQAPRPFELDMSVKMLSIPGYSFPSGAAQTSIFFAYWLLRHYRHFSSSIPLLAVLFALNLSFSRIYLAAHFPGDIFCGWLVGFTVVFLTRFIYVPFRVLVQAQSKKNVALLTLLLSIGCIGIYALFPNISHILPVAATVMLGELLLAHFFIQRARTLPEKIAQYFISIFVFFLIYNLKLGLPKNAELFIKLSFMGLWLSFIQFYLFHTLKGTYQVIFQERKRANETSFK